MNGGVHWPQFIHLRAHTRDKAPVGRAAVGQQLRFYFIIVLNGVNYRINQLTAAGQERLA